MFTGIIKSTGTVDSNNGALLRVRAKLGRLKRGASVAVNGVCLTAVGPTRGAWKFNVSPETLRLTNLGRLKPGERVNLELPLKLEGLLGGHLVSGHVDACVPVLQRAPMSGGFTRLRVDLPRKLGKLVAYKGSVALDGVSLTVTRVGAGYLETVLIPETLAATTLGARARGDKVNLEVDLIARYLERMLPRRSR